MEDETLVISLIMVILMLVGYVALDKKEEKTNANSIKINCENLCRSGNGTTLNDYYTCVNQCFEWEDAK